jgi:hypothetical protein
MLKTQCQLMTLVGIRWRSRRPVKDASGDPGDPEAVAPGCSARRLVAGGDLVWVQVSPPWPLPAVDEPQIQAPKAPGTPPGRTARSPKPGAWDSLPPQDPKRMGSFKVSIRVS